ASFLEPLGITHERVHAGIVFVFDRQQQQNQPVSGGPSVMGVSTDALKMLTPRAKKAIVLAWEEMKSQGEENIRPIHLLLGVMSEGEGIGAGLMRSLGVNLLQVRAALVPAAVNQHCSFCGRSGSQVARFFPAEVDIVGNSTPSPDALICDHC